MTTGLHCSERRQRAHEGVAVTFILFIIVITNTIITILLLRIVIIVMLRTVSEAAFACVGGRWPATTRPV